jgi:hypothetical protein
VNGLPPDRSGFERRLVAGPEGDRRRPTGVLERFCGEQFTLEQVAGVELPSADPRFVRAFPLLPLYGDELDAERDDELAAALERLLHERLPGIRWHVALSLAPLRVYGILHTSLHAPPDETTGETMAIELWGEVVRWAGPMSHGEPDWFAYRRLGAEYRRKEQLIEKALPGPLTVEIRGAVYANIPCPNIDVPFYL